MVNEATGSADERKPGTPPKILTKPLPQILDEMDDNITASAEAARKAEAAARAAKEAAGAATNSSKEAAKRADEARQAGEKAACASKEKLIQKQRYGEQENDKKRIFSLKPDRPCVQRHKRQKD